MQAQPGHPAEEIERLQRCVNDLDGVTALPAIWGGGEPAEIVRTLLEVLPGTLSLDLIYVRSEVAVGEPPLEMARVAQSLSLPAGPQEIGKLFDRWLGDDPQEWPPLARHTVGDGDVTVVPLRLGLRGEIGVLVAGSRRADFPQQTERLVLSVAANQATIGLQQARLLSEQRRVAVELDERVAQRTRELAAANEVLKKEVAERERAEEALRDSESEQRFRAIFDEAGTGISLVDLQQPDTPIQNNRALQTMLGVTREELGFFATYDELTAEGDRAADAATFRELCSGERDSLRQEKHFILRDGSSVWANVIFTLLRDSSGRPRFIIAIHEDITERKRAVERLQDKQELLDLAQKSARAMAFDWYIQQDVNVWSPEQESLYGLQPGSFDGTYQSWKKLIYAPDWPVLLKAIKHAHETGEVAVEFRVQWPDGSFHWLATNGQMFFDEQGQPFRMVGFTSDITPRKLAEEDLRKLRSELAHVSRVATLGALTASIAHEVNQPLSGIITNASTCLRMLNAEPPNVEGARETARRTIRDGNRASDVIKRLRALFSKRDATTESVDLNEATREVMALSLSELQRGRVILRTELADDLPPVTGDRVQLQQVILNLLLNASDAMSGVEDRPKELVIRTGPDEGDGVRLSVQDAGVGFDPQDVGRLFEAFYTTKGGGMGIGLSVSRSIIESHHGRLWATPNDGPGATFSFSIPRASRGVTDASSIDATRTSALTDAEGALRKAQSQ